MNEFNVRRKVRIDAMKENSLAFYFAGSLIPSSADAHYPFIVNRNFYYLTGLKEDELILMIQKTALGVKESLWIKDANPMMEKWVGRFTKAEEAQDISGVLVINTLSNFEAYLDRVLLSNEIEHVYIDAERQHLKLAHTAVEHFAQDITKAYPHIQIHNVNKSLAKQRRIKSESELEMMVKAMHVTHRGLNRILSELKPGRYEYQVAADFSYQVQLENCTHAFSTIAASGSDATILHYVENSKALKEGDLILCDLGAAYQNYASDITRTYPVSGRFSPRQKELYEIVLKAQEAVINAIKPGISLLELNNIVKEVYKIECVRANVIEKAEDVDTVYYHGVSHLLGLDTHDVGHLEGMKLEEGMVITVEPGLYSAVEGIGIRIEDNILVTKTGSQNLSAFIEKSVEDIEAILNPSK